jgi:5-methylcytosine-specific restriction protein A
VARIRGRKLQALRAQLFRQQPLSVICQAEGRTSVATIRDHIIPLAEGGQDVEQNTQALCETCADLKTQQESARGSARMRNPPRNFFEARRSGQDPHGADRQKER